MNLVLIRAIDDRDVNRYLPSLGLGYIKSCLEKHIPGIEVIITDSMKVLIKENPDIVGISSVTSNFNIAIEMGNTIKNKLKVPVIIGGHHISALPHTLPECFDVGVIGEGEETMKELMKIYISQVSYHHDPHFNKLILRNIKGIVFHDDHDQIVITEPRQQIKNLDTLPYPYRGQIKEDYVHMVTSRGCPYSCVFCSSSSFWKTTRFFSAEYMINEIVTLLAENTRIKEILFWDDLFIADRKRLKEIVKQINDLRINKKVSFECTVRANLVDEELCALLKIMNVKVVSMGLESGCDKTLNYLKQGNVTVDDNKRAVLLLNKWGFVVRSSFIIGCPDETRNEMLETLWFIKSNPIDLGATYVLMPLPGTCLWDQAKERNLVDDHMDWSRFNPGQEDNRTVVMSSTMTQEELLQIHNMFVSEWKRKSCIFDSNKPRNITVSSILKSLTHLRDTYNLIKNICLYNLKYKR